MKIKHVSQRVKVDAPFGSVSVEISPHGTLGDHVAGLDAEQVEKDVELFAAIGTKMNPRKWVKKYDTQVG